MIPTRILDALNASPGPRTPRQAALLVLKGFCMGSADVVPGVSGGTIAFITGIYENLLAAIKSFDAGFFGSLLRLDLCGALSRAHLRFLVPLLVGLVLAVVSMARVIHFLLLNHPVQVWSLFFGLIAASILVVGRTAGRMDASAWIAGASGTLVSWLLVGLVPVTTPEQLWFVFICGALAICAMILPGISGAFILLLLGKHEFITRIVKAPFEDGNALVLLVFVSGCAVGIMSFVRLLHYLLRRWPTQSVCLLAGFMLGALRKVWPWKEVLESTIIGHRTVVLREANVLPDALDGSVALALVLAAAGFALVLLLERLGSGHD